MTSSTKTALLLIGAVALLSTLYNAFVPLHGDEAYYWVWSRHLQAGYYDHPPMIALLIKAATLISDSEWGVRLVGVFSLSVSAWFIYRMAREIIDPRGAFYALLIFLSIPLTHGGLLITNPDAPLILFWTLALHFAIKALREEQLKDFMLTGLFLGLAMLSKYTAILLAGSLLLYLLLYRRPLLTTYKTWSAIAVALLIIAPMLWWNYTHDWISFRFQLDHGGMGNSVIRFEHFCPFFSGQFAIFTPIFMGLALLSLFRASNVEASTLRLLRIAFVVPLLFFLYQSFYAKMELNYAAPAYIAGVMLAAIAIHRFELKKWFTAGLVLALFLTITARIALLCCLERVQDRMVGFKEAAAMVATHRHEGDALYGNHLTTASLLSYYLADHPDVSIATKSRPSQYTLWGTTLQDGLVLSYRDVSDTLQQRFDSVTLLETQKRYKGDTLFRTFYLFRVAHPTQPQL